MKKGQVSIEYLATYGWAIMILLVMVSLLTYFGVIDIKNFAPDRCEIGAELSCIDFTFEDDGNNVSLKLYVSNNLAERIFIYNMTCGFQTQPQNTQQFVPPISLGSEDKTEIVCSTTDNTILGIDGKLKAEFSMTYKKKDKPFDHDIDGSAFGQKVEV